MRQVGVHLDEDLVGVLEPVIEAGSVRGAEPILLGAAQYDDLATVRADALGRDRGAVRAVVVHDRDVDPRRLDPGAGEDELDVGRFFVGRDDHERSRVRDRLGRRGCGGGRGNSSECRPAVVVADVLHGHGRFQSFLHEQVNRTVRARR